MSEPEKVGDSDEMERARKWLERMAPGTRIEPEPGKVSETLRCKICGVYAVQNHRGDYVFDHNTSRHNTDEGPQELLDVPSPRMVGDDDRPAGRSLFGYDN